MNAALRIAQALDQHLSRPTPVVVFGTGALLLDPAFKERLLGRMTNDIDLIIPSDREIEVDADGKSYGFCPLAAGRTLYKYGTVVDTIGPTPRRRPHEARGNAGSNACFGAN